MYRLLRAHGEVRERRRHARHPARVKPELVAYRPNELSSWDMTQPARSGPRGVLLL
jgi:putative transposase